MPEAVDLKKAQRIGREPYDYLNRCVHCRRMFVGRKLDASCIECEAPGGPAKTLEDKAMPDEDAIVEAMAKAVYAVEFPEDIDRVWAAEREPIKDEYRRDQKEAWQAAKKELERQGLEITLSGMTEAAYVHCFGKSRQ